MLYLKICLSWILTSVVASSQLAGIVQEYCPHETFSPDCNSNEVIVMNSAKYGRMRVGKCVSNDFGYVGCSTNSLREADQMCSGLKQCEIRVPNPDMDRFLACPQDLSRYLEASYTCKKVYIPTKPTCNSPEKVQAGKTPGYIASVISQQTLCGLHGSPWIVEAQPGQRLEMTLIDFAWLNNTNEVQNDCNKHYGYILDVESDDVIPVCGGGAQRTKIIYTSITHVIQIVLEGAFLNSDKYLIKYRATGCPNVEQSSHSWVKKNGDKIVIGCIYASQNWTLICRDSMWLGVVGTCPSPTTEKTKTVAESTTASMTNSGWGNLPHVSDNHVIAFALACITVVICCSVIILGVYCSRRYEAKIRKYKSEILQKSFIIDESMAATLDRQTLIYRPINTNDSSPPPSYNGALPMQMSLRSNVSSPQSIPNSTPLSCRSYSRREPPPSLNGNFESGYGSSIDDEPNKYYVLENPAETLSAQREQVYQSIHQLQQNLMD